MSDKCPKCGSQQTKPTTKLGTRGYACGTVSYKWPRTTTMESQQCLVHQLAQAKAEIKQLRGLLWRGLRYCDEHVHYDTCGACGPEGNCDTECMAAEYYAQWAHEAAKAAKEARP